MRPTIVDVLPVPADAMIRFCLSLEVAALYCSLFKRDNGKSIPFLALKKRDYTDIFLKRVYCAFMRVRCSATVEPSTQFRPFCFAL